MPSPEGLSSSDEEGIGQMDVSTLHTQMTAPITGPSTEVVDVDQAAEDTASEGLARMLAGYGSGSDDADPSKDAPEVIEVETNQQILHEPHPDVVGSVALGS